MAQKSNGLTSSSSTDMALRERPPNLHRKPSSPARLGLQPREAKINRDTSLIDLATFLRDTPAPMDSAPELPKSENYAFKYSTSPHNSLVRRVFRVGSRLSTQPNTIDQARSRPTGLEFGQSAPVREEAYESEVQRGATISMPSTSPERDISATRTTSAGTSGAESSPVNPMPNLVNLLGEDVHAMYATWLDKEMANKRRRSSALGKVQAEPATDAELSAVANQNQQSRDEIKVLSHAVQDTNPTSKHLTSNGEQQELSATLSASANQEALVQDSSKCVPSRRSFLFAHAPGPLSPPPQKPLPPTPVKTSLNDDRRESTRVAQGIAAHQILDKRQSRIEDQRRIEAQSTIHRGTRRMFLNVTENLAREDSSTIPNLYNMDAHLPNNESDKSAQVVEDKLIDKFSIFGVIDRSNEAREVVTPPDTGYSSSIAQTHSSDGLAATSKSPNQKAREGRTRARKLKHMRFDSKSTTTTEAVSVTEDFSEAPPMLKKKTSRPEPLDLSKCKDTKTESDPQRSSNRLNASRRDNGNAGLESSLPSAVHSSLSASHESVSSTKSATLLQTPKNWPSGVDISTKAPSVSIHSISNTSSSVVTPARLSYYPPDNISSSRTNLTKSAPEDRATETVLVTSDHTRAPSTANSTDLTTRYSEPDPDETPPAPHLTFTKPLHSRDPTATANLKQHASYETPPLSPQSNPSGYGTPRGRDLHARVAHLERENKLLEAALMAVLKTNGSLNRCPCPCYCSANDDAVNLPGLPAAALSRGATDGYVASDGFVRERSPARAAAGAVELKPAVRDSLMLAEPENAASNRSSAVVHASAAAGSLRGSNGTSSALELYKQTRRASTLAAAAKRAS